MRVVPGGSGGELKERSYTVYIYAEAITKKLPYLIMETPYIEAEYLPT